MNLPYALSAMIAVLVVGEAAVDSRRATLPIDRWLISEVFEPDSSEASRLDKDLLQAPGEAGVLPDRGMEAAGSTWSLHRNDPVGPDVALEAPRGSVVYAHVYVRLPEDRTLRLVWSPEDCTAGRLWVNGRPTAGHSMAVRFGAGWNTILIKLESGDCGFGFGAMMVADDAAGLDGVRLQASRPPGDVRTGPQPWAIPHDTVFVSSDRRWRDDRLFAGLGVRLTAWGRSEIPGVRVQLEGAAEGRGEGQWMTPGETAEIIVPVRLDRLNKLLQAGVVESRIRWDGGSQVAELVVAGEVAAASPNIVLDGWRIASGDQLPGAAGSKVAGEWKVPAALDGRRLDLVITESPATFRVNGTETMAVGDTISLCAPCSRGTRLAITGTTTGPWQRMPVVHVSSTPGQ